MGNLLRLLNFIWWAIGAVQSFLAQGFTGWILGVLTDLVMTAVLLFGNLAGFLLLFYPAGVFDRLLLRRRWILRRRTREVLVQLVGGAVWFAVAVAQILLVLYLWPDAPVVAFAGLFVVASVSMTVLAVVATALPGRRRRHLPRWGRNRAVARSVRGAAYAVMASGPSLALLAVAYLVWVQRDWVAALAALVVTVPMGTGISIFIGNSIAEAASRIAVAADEVPGEPFVLFLRPFRDDDRPFGFTRSLTDGGRSFEEFFGEAVRARLGSIVALANPYDCSPAPEQHRIHVDPGEEWQDLFRRLAHRSVCVLTAPSLSGNTLWEFEEMRRLGLAHKLFIMTPSAPQHQHEALAPASRRRLDTMMSRAATLLYAADLRRSTAEKQMADISVDAAWKEMAAALNHGGFTVGPEPTFGAVVGFDSCGRAHTLSSDANDAEAYVAVVRQHVDPGASVRPSPASPTSPGRPA